MVNAIEEPTESKKRGAYPYYSIGKALEIGGIVADIGGNTGGVTRSQIAERLGVEEESASLQQTISAAKCFGIIEGRGAISLTGDGKKYFMPTSNGDKHHAKLSFLMAPTVFEHLLTKYDGAKLPSNEMLANLVQRDCSVPESWKQRVASLFVSSLRDVEAVDTQGIVRFDSAKRRAPEDKLAVQEERAGQSTAEQKPPAPKIDQHEVMPTTTISFPIGPDRYLTVPKDLTTEDCDIIGTMLPALQAYAKRGTPKLAATAVPATEQRATA